MKVELAKSAGFCFGVDRAVAAVYRLVEEGEKAATLGPIIHNPQVTEDLASKFVWWWTVRRTPLQATCW